MEPGIRCKPLRPGILPSPAPPFPFGKITKAALQENGGSLKTEMRIGLTRQCGKLAASSKNYFLRFWARDFVLTAG